jgi:predicted nucleotide-binding protein (sugar kinase/HSP70/actin superfamily)
MSVVGVALIPIFRKYIHGLNYKKILRLQIHLELYELKYSFRDKKNHIEKDPNNIPGREFKKQDKEAIARFEQIFEKATYLTKEERTLLNKLLAQYRAYTFKYLREAIDKSGIEEMEQTIEEVITLYETKFKIEPPPKVEW